MAIPESELRGRTALQLDEPETLRRLKALMAPVEFTVAVTGTRRGVGVSTCTFNLALALRHAKFEGLDTERRRVPTVGILDLGGSSFPQRFGGAPRGLEKRGPRLLPAGGLGGVKVVTLDMVIGEPSREGMASLRDWGPVQRSLGEVEWDGLDLLLIELPAGIEAVEDLSEVLPAIDAALIVSRAGERERIRRLWQFFDASSTPAIGLVSNMEGRSSGENVEGLGQTFGIPIRVAIPYEPALATIEAETAPYVLTHKETKVSQAFYHLSEHLVEYLVWLHDEHGDEEDF
ncbi:MAG: P-loop NTPase [Candidatus Methylomirabilales bacterium]